MTILRESVSTQMINLIAKLKKITKKHFCPCVLRNLSIQTFKATLRIIAAGGHMGADDAELMSGNFPVIHYPHMVRAGVALKAAGLHFYIDLSKRNCGWSSPKNHWHFKKLNLKLKYAKKKEKKDKISSDSHFLSSLLLLDIRITIRVSMMPIVPRWDFF